MQNRSETGVSAKDGASTDAPPAAPHVLYPPDFNAWRGLTDKLQEAFVVGEMLYDSRGEATDWRYLEINPAWETYHGLRRDDVVGRTVRTLYPRLRHDWISCFAELVRSGQPIEISRQDANERFFEGRAFALGKKRFVALYVETSQRRRATETASQLTALVQQSTDFIGIADPDEHVRFVNPAGLKLVGLSSLADAPNTRIHDFLVPEAGAATTTQAVLSAIADKGFWDGEAEFRNFQTGERVPVHHTVFPVRDAGGALTGYGTVTRDLRARYQSEARRAALLELGDRLRNMDDPDEMSLAASEIMLRVLNASRAGYGTVNATRETVVIARDCTASGIASLAGSYRFREFGSYIEDLNRNETVVFNDTDTDPRAVAAAWQSVGARAVINLPIFEHGAFVAVVLVHQTVPRAWQAEELAFVRNVADRTRAAMERRHAELRLRDLAASLERQVAERTADRNLLWQLSTDIMVVTRRDGRAVTVNPAWDTVLGWSEQDLVGRSLAELIHPDDMPVSICAVQRVIEGERLRRFDNRYRHRDGSYRTISWTAVAGGDVIIAVGRDVTDERARAAALELSEGRLRSVFETSYGYQGLLTPEGIVVDANPASLRGIEARLEDVVGRPYWETPWFSGTPGLPALIRAAIPAVAAGASVRQEIEADLPTGKRIFDVSIRPVHNSTGRVIAIVPEAIEVTEQRAAEAQLRQAQKMEAVGQLTGGLAHDFNNLMTGITGNLELLASRVGQGRTQDLERYVEAAQGAARRAASLTHRLLAFSRQQTLDPKLTDVNHLVTGMEEMIRRTMGPDVAVTVAAETALWHTHIDQNQLENALLNLCINARQAMPRGGRLTIETCNKVLDARAAAERDLPAGDYVTLCVSDTGIGMTPDVVARAFDPFFTTKPIGEGTGLGLSMIYGFVRQSGGQARIFSEPGQGCMISLYLPRHHHSGAIADPPAAPPEAAPSTRNGETVLVIDDEPTVRMLVTEVLEDLGYSTLNAEDGAGGLAILRGDAPIDLMISDVGLPGGMNGRELADAALLLRPGLRIVFITGYAEHAVVSHGRLRPGMQILTKPFTIEALANRVKDILSAAPPA